VEAWDRSRSPGKTGRMRPEAFAERLDEPESPACVGSGPPHYQRDGYRFRNGKIVRVEASLVRAGSGHLHCQRGGHRLRIGRMLRVEASLVDAVVKLRRLGTVDCSRRKERREYDWGSAGGAAAKPRR
jgi:hypothetical protein